MGSNGKIPTHTDRVRDLAKFIADQEDEPEEITAEHYINVEPGGTVIVDQTGKHRAISIPDSDPPESDAEPPPKLSPLAIAWLLVRKFPPWGAVLVALAGIGAYVALRR